LASAPDGQQQPDDVGDVRSSWFPWLGPAARQRCNQRWKTSAIRRIGIGADPEQRADERQRAMVDGVLEAAPDCKRHWSVRHAVRIADSAAQRGQVALAESGSIFLNFSCSAQRFQSDLIVDRISDRHTAPSSHGRPPDHTRSPMKPGAPQAQICLSSGEEWTKSIDGNFSPDGKRL
jgi:hypothetical protein